MSRMAADGRPVATCLGGAAHSLSHYLAVMSHASSDKGQCMGHGWCTVRAEQVFAIMEELSL